MRKHTDSEAAAECRNKSGQTEVLDRADLPEIIYNHAGVDIRTLSAGGFTLNLYYFDGVRIPRETAAWCVSRYSRTGRRVQRLEVYYHMHPEKQRRLAPAL